ncbi:hypothetical protein V1477_005896 [Vespula maculifrons]|uniref:Uncharacterized protein n=1 Tax=Vespula maculifrons TaxID=7453 RepID=A0ABD2CLK5_VESMC
MIGLGRAEKRTLTVGRYFCQNTSIGHRHSIAILNPFSCASSSCSWFKRHIEMDDTCSRFDAELQGV